MSILTRACCSAVIAAATAALLSIPCSALPPDTWDVDLAISSGRGGFAIWVDPIIHDVYYLGPNIIDPGATGAYCLPYYDAPAESGLIPGFYGGVGWAPFAPGESRTLENIYVWAYSMPPGPQDRATFVTQAQDEPGIPIGYTADLVLDYVPEAANWAGQPMTFHLLLDQDNTLTLPVVTVTDPLQGVRMHLTVYAPLPEPSSLAALSLALMGLCGGYLRRRR